jgi:hypothetical protein
MFSRKSVELAGVLLDGYKVRGLQVRAVDGHPVSGLSAHTSAALPPMNGDDKISLATAITWFQRAGEDDTYHSELQSQIASNIAQAASLHINTIKNTVIPKVNLFYSNLKSSVQAMQDEMGGEDVEVYIWTHDAFTESQGFIDKVELMGADASDVDTGYNIANVAARSDLSWFLSFVPDSEFSVSVKSLMRRMPISWLDSVWNSAFCSAWIPPKSWLNNFQVPVNERFERSICVAAWAEGLLENVQTSPHTLSEYRTLISKTRNSAYSLVANIMRSVNSAALSGTLVADYIPNGAGVVVYSKAYQKFLDDGGTVDALKGAIVSNKTVSVTVILADKDKYQSAYSAYRAMGRRNINDTVRNNLPSLVERLFYDGLEDLTDVEKAWRSQHSMPSYERLISEVSPKLDLLSTLSEEDLYEISVLMIASVRFFFTPAEGFMRHMVVSERENPGISPENAAALATYNYVIGYLLRGVSLVDSGGSIPAWGRH